jgi:hypothetical protein
MAESGRMGHIYSQAVCTIAATASKNSNGGLFFERSGATVPRRVNVSFSPSASWGEGHLTGSFLCDAENLAGRCIEDAPLNSRAWVSQERQLSRRLLHFSNNQLFWECHELMACETYPGGLPKLARSFWSNDPTALKKSLYSMMQKNKASSVAISKPLARRSGMDNDTYFAWCSFRILYSRYNLTRGSDKLVALHGIAQWVGSVTGDELVAGLWRSRIIEELCWFKNDHKAKSISWRAPTWSWASSDALIWASSLTKFHGEHSSLCLEAELEDVHVSSKDSGELEDAFMQIKCKPLRSVFTPATILESRDERLDGLLTLIDSGLEPLEVWLPTKVAEPNLRFEKDDVSIDEQLHGYVVVIQRCLHSKDNLSHLDSEHAGLENDKSLDSEGSDYLTQEDSLEALFLRRNPEDPEKFERAGLLCFGGSMLVRNILRAHRTMDSQILTLV